VLDAYERLMGQGYFTVSEESTKVLDEYKIDTDAVSSFIDEKQYYPVEIGKGIEKSLPELFEEFKRYCNINNFHQLTNKTFSGRLRDAGFQYKRKSDSNYVYLGVKYDVDAEVSKIANLWDNGAMGEFAEVAPIVEAPADPVAVVDETADINFTLTPEEIEMLLREDKERIERMEIERQMREREQELMLAQIQSDGAEEHGDTMDPECSDVECTTNF